MIALRHTQTLAPLMLRIDLLCDVRLIIGATVRTWVSQRSSITVLGRCRRAGLPLHATPHIFAVALGPVPCTAAAAAVRAHGIPLCLILNGFVSAALAPRAIAHRSKSSTHQRDGMGSATKDVHRVRRVGGGSQDGHGARAVAFGLSVLSGAEGEVEGDRDDQHLETDQSLLDADVLVTDGDFGVILEDVVGAADVEDGLGDVSGYEEGDCTAERRTD